MSKSLSKEERRRLEQEERARRAAAAGQPSSRPSPLQQPYPPDRGYPSSGASQQPYSQPRPAAYPNMASVAAATAGTHLPGLPEADAFVQTWRDGQRLLIRSEVGSLLMYPAALGTLAAGALLVMQLAEPTRVLINGVGPDELRSNASLGLVVSVLALALGIWLRVRRVARARAVDQQLPPLITMLRERPQSVVWIYGNETSIMRYGATMRKEWHIYIADDRGERASMPIPGGEAAMPLALAIVHQRYAPQARLGFTREMEQAYSQNPGAFRHG